MLHCCIANKGGRLGTVCRGLWCLAGSTLCCLPPVALAAEKLTTTAPAVANAPSPSFRRLAPGVMVTIDPERKREEDSSIHDVVELLRVDPSFSWAQAVRFEHSVWALEFSFKPPRFIEVDVAGVGGRVTRQKLWYLVYKVRNPGNDPVKFVPRFWLESRDVKQSYPDALVSVAIPAIRLREDPRRPLLNSVEMDREIPPSGDGVDRGVWGVATWQGIDPRTDRFAIFVQGLTNAYRWRDAPAAAAAERTVERKTLQLNFWRPGDAYHEHEDEIRFGAPEDVDYRWIYR